jgi:hypothetical protein
MIFNRSSSLQSKKSVSEIKSVLIGKNFLVHNINFEITDLHGIMRVLPHAEEIAGERILTLPVTRVILSDNSNGTKVKLSSHPRRTDIGGPMLLMIACILFFVVGLLLLYKGSADVRSASILMIGISATIGLLFWIKMEFGYFDYVRKIKNYIKGLL